MIQELKNQKFDQTYLPKAPVETDYVFYFQGNGRRSDCILLAQSDHQITIPTIGEMKPDRNELQYLFAIDEVHFYLHTGSKFPADTKQYSFQPIRTLRLGNPRAICFAGMTAYHLFTWYRDNQFCGRCGHVTEHSQSERMLACPSCGNMIYPKICPAVIIGLRKGNQILMSRYANREYKGKALLAGFCEIGETPEETVVREVMEEVGLKVKNITYYGSQPWGFDSNLLLGYFADVDGDDIIQLDEQELASAAFVERDNIAPESNLISLTATMIEEFRLGNW